MPPTGEPPSPRRDADARFPRPPRRQPPAGDVPVPDAPDRAPQGPAAGTQDEMLQLLDDTHARDLEAQLVRRARAGDRASFEELVRVHLSQVYRVVFRLVGSHEDAEDLAQECFVRAWRGLAWYRGDSAFATWLCRIAVHLAQDHLRARSRRGGATSLAHDAPLAAREVPAEDLDRRESLQRLRSAIERLPARMRASLVLRVFEGWEYADVARSVGVTPATARTQVMRARKLLVRWMAPWLERRKP